MEILRDLRQGEFDVLVGVNLLREGLDLPEVSLVAILDADKEGFLRSARPVLIQTIGRSRPQRQRQGRSCTPTRSPTRCSRRSTRPPRRREIQAAYNQRARHHAGDDPQGDPRGHRGRGGRPRPVLRGGRPRARTAQYITEELLAELQAEMLAAAEALEFERAAALRDRIQQMREQMGKPRGGGQDRARHPRPPRPPPPAGRRPRRRPHPQAAKGRLAA